VVVYTCNLSAYKADIGGLQVQGQPGQLSKTLSTPPKKCQGCGLEIESLTSMHKALGSIPSTGEKKER
jgi:hypothetical protein